MKYQRSRQAHCTTTTVSDVATLEDQSQAFALKRESHRQVVRSGKIIVRFNRLTVLFLLFIASAWVALVNGQPLFFADTSSYVRGPDFAVVYLFGNKFATSWTQQRTLQEPKLPARPVIAEPPAQNASLNSPLDQMVLAGRSVFYGALLYFGHLASHLWLSVFAQAAIFLYLTYTFAIKCARLSFSTFACATSAILVATPVSFYISFLMPDVFASFLILATMIVVGFWDTLKLRDKVFVSTIMCYSTLTHLSHLLLLICLAIVFACVSFVAERKVTMSGSVRKRAIVLFVPILAGFFGEQAFWYGARYMVGADPIRPPFLMARLIADGPGYKFLQKNCATKAYIVCNYIDRLQFDASIRTAEAKSDAFVWSMNSNAGGVFSAVDLATRRALSSEQTSFAIDVFRSDPIGTMNSATRNSISQLLMVGLDEFFFDQTRVQSFKGKLPESYFDGLLRSHLVLRGGILAPGNELYFFVYFLSTIGLVLTWACWPLVQFQKKFDIYPRPQWFHVLTVSVMAIVFNAIICGVLSGPNPRYQTRISWIPTFILLLMIAKLYQAFRSSKEQIKLGPSMNRVPRLPPRFSATALSVESK